MSGPHHVVVWLGGWEVEKRVGGGLVYGSQDSVDTGSVGLGKEEGAELEGISGTGLSLLN